ncbi:hypothetical protein, partial [Budvicia diplopodorum]|uniref:hypothetical protein n=1 Tax=Budvicia diplopodorum TaxID=1119056 RepID=UPI00135CECDB
MGYREVSQIKDLRPRSNIFNSNTIGKNTIFSLSRISAAVLLALVFLPEALAQCTPDSSGSKFTCSGSASDHVLLDLTGNTGDVQVTSTPDYVSNDSLYIGNKWVLFSGISEPYIQGDTRAFRSNSLSVLLEAGNKLSQHIAPEQESLRRALYIEASTNKLSVMVNRDIEQSLYGSGENTYGYQHVIDIRNVLDYADYLPGLANNYYSPTENDISISGNIRQTAINTDLYRIHANEYGGFIGVNAAVAGIKNRIVVSGDITQDIISDSLNGSFSTSVANIAAVKIFSNSKLYGSNYSAQFAPLPIVEKAENYIDISGNIKQNFSIRDELRGYVQSGSNYINNAVFVNVGGVNNTVLISGDIEKTTSANLINEMIGSGVNVQSNLYDGLNTGTFSAVSTPGAGFFIHEIVNNVNISGNIKQTVAADTVHSDTSASSGRQAFSTAGVQVMGNQNTISVSGDVSKEIDISSSFNAPPGAAILVQANATPLATFSASRLSFTPEMWDMVARTQNKIDISGNVIHRMTGGQHSMEMLYDNINHSSVDINANGINNIISVSGDIEKSFSGEFTRMPLYSNAALAIRSNITEVRQIWGTPILYSPFANILEKTQNSIHVSGNVNQEISYQDGRSSSYSRNFDSNFEPSSELFATDIVVAGRNSTLLISGNTQSSVSLNSSEDDSIPAHAGGIRLRNYYGDMDTVITGKIAVSDEKDVANGLLNTTPPSRCLTVIGSGCLGSLVDIKYASVGVRATNYGDVLNLAIEGDIVSSGIGIQVRPFAENPTIITEDWGGELLLKGKGDVMVDIAARVQGSGGYAL